MCIAVENIEEKGDEWCFRTSFVVSVGGLKGHEAQQRGDLQNGELQGRSFP